MQSAGVFVVVFLFCWGVVVDLGFLLWLVCLFFLRLVGNFLGFVWVVVWFVTFLFPTMMKEISFVYQRFGVLINELD